MLYIIVDGIKYELKKEAIDEARVEFADAEPLCETCGEPLLDNGEVYGHPTDAHGCSIVCRVCDERVRTEYGNISAPYEVRSA